MAQNKYSKKAKNLIELAIKAYSDDPKKDAQGSFASGLVTMAFNLCAIDAKQYSDYCEKIGSIKKANL